VSPWKSITQDIAQQGLDNVLRGLGPQAVKWVLSASPNAIPGYPHPLSYKTNNSGKKTKALLPKGDVRAIPTTKVDLDGLLLPTRQWLCRLVDQADRSTTIPLRGPD
jgi:hypothetical protein